VAALRERLVLAIVATDATFEKQELRGEPHWVGKCIHCNARLVVSTKGETFGATIEHIVPRTHGGTDALENVALACARCNSQKGVRIDPRRRSDPKLVAVIEILKTRRQERWRSEGNEDE
jgi:5-methylcytosine-specific restriction endonuclease McrA